MFTFRLVTALQDSLEGEGKKSPSTSSSNQSLKGNIIRKKYFLTSTNNEKGSVRLESLVRRPGQCCVVCNVSNNL